MRKYALVQAFGILFSFVQIYILLQFPLKFMKALSKKKNKKMVKERHTASPPNHMVTSVKILCWNLSSESALATDLDNSQKAGRVPIISFWSGINIREIVLEWLIEEGKSLDIYLFIYKCLLNNYYVSGLVQCVWHIMVNKQK